jgi:WD40 repeat protein
MGDYVKALAFSPDHRSFVCGTFNGVISICDAGTGNLIAGPFHYPSSPGAAWSVNLDEETPSVKCVGFLPGGQFVLAGYSDSTMWVWDVETGDKFVCCENNSACRTYSAQYFACYRNRIALLLIKSGNGIAVEMLSFAVSMLEFGNCTKHLLLPEPDAPILGMLPLSPLCHFAISITGQYMAISGFSGKGGNSEVIVYNMADQTFREEWRFSHNDEPVRAFLFSPDDRSLAICFAGGSVL